ncbi:hypothetical protein [Streptomyces sp. NPDC059552]|uniref:hypothetical protein n=1 Tax=Streptomyces sp. NPDC059552 TaxID=3346862 RepID=UPI00367F9460
MVDPIVPFTISGQQVIEIGLSYLPGMTLPKQPHAWRTGSVDLGSDALMSVSYWSGHGDIIRRGDRTRREFGGLVGPRGVSRCGEGLAVIAQPSIGRLSQVDSEGRIRQHLDLPGVSPWFACRWQDRWLVSDDTRKAVLMVSLDGRTIDQLPTPFPLRSVRSAVPLDDNHYLLCDRESQSVVVLSRLGELVWRYGRTNYPSSEDGCLTSPEHAIPLQAGVAIADTRNHRVLFVNWQGEPVWSLGGVGQVGSSPGRLWHPISVSSTPDGSRLLVTDAGNDRVLEVSLDGQVTACHGDSLVDSGIFHLPRSLESTPAGYAVADSYNNRVSTFGPNGQGIVHTSTALDKPLFWPRHTSVIDGITVVSDSRNGRVLVSHEENSHGWRELALTLAGRHLELIDPHAVRKSKRGWLLTDTGLNAVLLFEPHTGEVLHAWCGEQATIASGTADVSRLPLEDVHDAVIDDDRTVWFANTGHNTLATLQYGASRLCNVTPVWPSGALSPLCAPRSVDVVGDQVLVTDSGNHRVVMLTRSGTVAGAYGRRRGHAIDCLSDPRFARISGSRIAIADYLNDRVLLVPRTALATDPPTMESAL